MSAELFLPLVCYALLFAVGALWIALDAEAAYIFDVFGKSFDYMWRHSGNRWKFTVMYGWRLLALASLICVCAYLAWPLASAVSNARAAFIIIFIALALIPFCLLPWIYIANGIRFRRALRDTARKLTPVANRLAVASDISAILDKAAYRVDPLWSAWHPKNVEDWPRVVPVVYVHAQPTTTVIFPFDWGYFLAWNLGGQLPPVGAALPFNGPGTTTFVLRSVGPLRGLADWSVFHAELQLDDEVTEAA
jgi:hypothetical protein